MSADTVRFNLRIPRTVWVELRAEAAVRQVTVSRVILERLVKEAGGDAGQLAQQGRLLKDDDGNKQRRVTIRLDNKLFERLSWEAADAGMTHAAMARQWLRRAAMAKGGADALQTIRAPDEVETVTAPEGRSVVFDF